MALSCAALCSSNLAWSYLTEAMKRVASSTSVMEKTRLILFRRESLNKFIPYAAYGLNTFVVSNFGTDLGNDDIKAFALRIDAHSS